MNVDYDELRDRYAEDLDRALAFSGQGIDFFTELKARTLLDLARRRLGDASRVEALDVGCGIGLTDAFLVPHLGRLTGVDVTPGVVEAAARRNPAARYELYDGHRLPFDDASFDLAFVVNVLQILERPHRRELVAEMARVTRPGGLVVSFEHNPLNPLTRLVVRRCSFARDVSLLRRGEAVRLLEQAGLVPEESRYVVFFPWRGSRLRALERRLGRVPLGAQFYAAGRRS